MTDKTTAPSGVVSSTELGGSMCCEPMLMFDRQGNPRTRYVAIGYDGANMIETPEGAARYLEAARLEGDDTAYTLTDTYLSKQEFDDLPDFEGF